MGKSKGKKKKRKKAQKASEECELHKRFAARRVLENLAKKDWFPVKARADYPPKSYMDKFRVLLAQKVNSHVSVYAHNMNSCHVFWNAENAKGIFFF